MNGIILCAAVLWTCLIQTPYAIGTYASQSWILTTPLPRKSSGHKSSCSRPSSPQTIGRKESTSNNATSVGNSPANTNLVCNTRMEERKGALRARNLAHQYADSAEAGNTSKPNTTSHAMTAFRLENRWKRSSRKTGSVLTSNAQFARNHISLTVKTAEDAMMPSNKPEDANLLPTNPSLLRTPSNNELDPQTQFSPQDTKPSPKGPTTPDTRAPEGHTHSRPSNQMLPPDPLINNPDINLLYE